MVEIAALENKARKQLQDRFFSDEEIDAIFEKMKEDTAFVSYGEKLENIGKRFRAPSYTDVPAEIIVQRARDNHLWLNAFSCVRPTDEFLMEVGRMVLNKLNNDADFTDGLGISPLIVVSINKS